MRHLIHTTALCAALATSAQADITYQGRDAQGLHCAAMLTIASALLYKANQISEHEFKIGLTGSAIILSQLPGTEAEKIQAMRQRADSIIRTRSLDQLGKEFNSTGKWCRREFLR